MQIACSKCLAVNRVPEERLREQPICGKCKQPLLPGHPLELTDANFDRVTSRTDIPIVVDFWAPWCGPCRSMAPAFEQAAAQLSPAVLLAKLNTDAHARTASGFQITGIPTIIAFRQGREVARQSGVMTQPQIVAWARALPL